jgi:hypothetical protein
VENNLVKLNHNRVLKFFEDAKTKYEKDYEEQCTEVQFVNIGRFINIIIDLLFILGIFVCVGFLFYYLISSHNDNKLLIFDNKIVEQSNPTKENILYIGYVLLIIIGATFWLKILMRNTLFSNIVIGFNSRKKKISKRKYFSEIRKDMIYYVRYNLNYAIREDMLVFDKYGMVIGPDLSTNENKKVFSEAERKLEIKHEQHSRNQLS